MHKSGKKNKQTGRKESFKNNNFYLCIFFKDLAFFFKENMWSHITQVISTDRSQIKKKKKRIRQENDPEILYCATPFEDLW